jgi:predicted small integral membrane protein
LRLLASPFFEYFVVLSVRGTTAVIEARIAKIVMVGSLALFAFIVAFDNITDYDTNFEFVRHVLSMDTIFPGSMLLYRRVISPALWDFSYWLIIGEGTTSLVLGIATVALLRHLRSDGARFNRAKRFVFIGTTLGFLVWFFGFMVVGGEWFQMWQSQNWNGQEAAFRFYLTILAVLIFVNQEDGDLRRGS